MGFTWHAALPRRRWALTSPFHPYNDLRLREKIVAVYFCCTVLEVTFTWRYQASCPTLLGLSSRCFRTPRPYNKLVSVIYIIARLFWNVAHFYAYFFFFYFCAYIFIVQSADVFKIVLISKTPYFPVQKNTSSRNHFISAPRTSVMSNIIFMPHIVWNIIYFYYFYRFYYIL